MTEETKLQKGTNPNRPAPGSVIDIQPIKLKKDIDAIKQLLSDKPRDFLLFVMGINNGIRASDLLKIKVGEVRNLKSGQALKIREKKTKKINVLVINKPVYKTLQNYFEKLNPADDDFLFQSRKGENKPLSVMSANNLIKTWTKAINLDGNYGTHSLRKTWGYHQRVTHNIGFEVIAERFMHSSPKTTMRYLGIDKDEVRGILMNEI
jgi:integrase